MEMLADWITPTERRIAILKVLCKRRCEKIKNLANECGVSERTIRTDIEHLSLSYPIETICGRHGGGIRIVGDFDLDRRYLNQQQKSLLERLKGELSGQDMLIMNSILNDFALSTN